MLSSTSALILSNTLLISPSKPVTLKNPQQQVWISDSQTLDAQSINQSLVLKAKKEGIAHVMGVRASADPLRVNVLNDATLEAIERCGAAYLDVTTSPPRVMISKNTKEEREKLEHLSQCGFKGLQLDSKSSEAFDVEFQSLEQRLSDQGVKILKVESESKRRVLTVSGKEALLALKVNALLSYLRPLYTVRYVEGPKPGRTLVFQLTLFEFSSAKAKALGLRWPEKIEFRTLDSKSWSASSESAVNGFNIGADFGESHGVGKILAQPQIRTKPGQRAFFQSGGEIPIRNSSIHAVSTTWKSYGLMVDIEPDAQSESGATEISTAFKVELSEPDAATAINGVPGMIVRKLESRFDLRVNESTILTTMIQTRSGHTRSGIHGLQGIPILGGIFSSDSQLDQKSELWFAIRPSWEDIL